MKKMLKNKKLIKIIILIKEIIKEELFLIKNYMNKSQRKI
jgi:hypothetical protein